MTYQCDGLPLIELTPHLAPRIQFAGQLLELLRSKDGGSCGAELEGTRLRLRPDVLAQAAPAHLALVRDIVRG
jgi:hypothetical protein